MSGAPELIEAIMKGQFLTKKIFWKVRHDVRQLGKYPRISWSKKVSSLKISQSIIYIKKYFYLFFSALKVLHKQKVKQIIELVKFLWLFA